MMNPLLSYICLCFLERCCLYSLLGSNSNITYYVDPSPNSRKLISPFLCYCIVFCSYLHYNTVYFNYLLLYLDGHLDCEVLLDREFILIILLLPEAYDWQQKVINVCRTNE